MRRVAKEAWNRRDGSRSKALQLRDDGTLPKASMPQRFQRLIDRDRAIRVTDVPGQWLDVDAAADVTGAGKFL